MPTAKVKRKPAKGGGSGTDSGSNCGSGSPGKPGFSSRNTCHTQRQPKPAAKPSKTGKAAGSGKDATAKPTANTAAAKPPVPAVPYAKTTAGIRDRIKDLSSRLDIARSARERLPEGSMARGMNLDSSVSLLKRLHAARQGLAKQLKDKRAAERPSLAQRTADVRAKLAANTESKPATNPIAKPVERPADVASPAGPAGPAGPAKPAASTAHPVDTAASMIHGLEARARLGTIDPSEFRAAAHAALAPLKPNDRARLTRDLGLGTHANIDKAADAAEKGLKKSWRKYGKMGEAPPPRWITPEPADGSRRTLARQIEDIRTRLS